MQNRWEHLNTIDWNHNFFIKATAAATIMPFIPEKLGVSSNEIVIQTMERLTSSKNACHFV